MRCATYEVRDPGGAPAKREPAAAYAATGGSGRGQDRRWAPAEGQPAAAAVVSTSSA
jgi:hypothetical protein